MKKTVTFNKDLEFPTMIGEIVEIALDDNLKFVDSSNIEGSFFINGCYKMTEASRLKEGFSFNIPVEIALTQNLEIETCDISISDFTYEIVSENILRCNIDVLVEGVEAIDLGDEVEELEDNNFEEEEKNRECDGDSLEDKEVEIPVKERNSSDLEERELNIVEELEIPKKENTVKKDTPILNEKINNEEISNSLFSNLADEDDSFSTYSIYIVREEDSVEKILEKYKITKEKLEEYNDLSNISLNSKIIIPSVYDEKN